MTARYLYFTGLIIIAIGCSEPESLVVKPQGDLIGTVLLCDSTGNPITEKAGTTVQLEGTPYSAVTDTDGRWIIKNISTATYTLSIRRNGFYPIEHLPYSFVGVLNIIPPLYLQEPIKQDFILDGAFLPALDNTSSGNIYGHFLPTSIHDSLIIGAVFFLSKSPLINSENNVIAVIEPVKRISTSMTSLSINIILNQISGYFHQGDTVFVRAYPYFAKTYVHFVNASTHRTIHIGLGSGSNILSTVLK